MKLNDAQKTNPLWAALHKHYTDRLAQLRMDNDNPTLGPEATAALRGRIDECKKFLDMGVPDEDISVAGM